MPRLIEQPAVVMAAGSKPKRIEEYAGQVSSGQANVSVARMVSPAGWKEPGQRPEFDEITVVLRGVVRVEHETGVIEDFAMHPRYTLPAGKLLFLRQGSPHREHVRSSRVGNV